jgi:hypothetical protein
MSKNAASHYRKENVQIEKVMCSGIKGMSKTNEFNPSNGKR